MTRKCIMRCCQNGYPSKRNENSRLGVRQKCLFKIPKCAELRKKWCEALGLQEDQLKPNQVVCEDHFNASDIVKYDVTHLPDGTRVLLEKGRYRLHPQAVPSIKTPIANVIKTKTPRVPINNLKKQDQTPKDTLAEHANVTADPFPLAKPIQVETCSTQKPVEIETAYSFARLVKDVKYSGRSSGWGSVLNVDFIDFLKWDASNFRITMVLRVFRDLKMKFYTADRHLIKSIDTVPQSFVEILQKLTLLEKTTFCEGNGLNNGRPAQCLGEVDVSKIQKRRGVWKRCEPCRDLRNKELERQRELKRDVQRRLKLTNRKNNRLKLKVNKLKEDVERAKKRCAGVEEKSLDERIEALPLPIQESVRTCLAAAKVKPRGRRYTLKWIHECMVIRMKSRRIYEYLRTHFILPLPCIDTLDRYIKKLNISRTGGDNIDLSENQLATIMPIEECDSPLLDDMTVTERLDSDKNEIIRRLEEMKKTEEIDTL